MSNVQLFRGIPVTPRIMALFLAGNAGELKNDVTARKAMEAYCNQIIEEVAKVAPEFAKVLQEYENRATLSPMTWKKFPVLSNN